MITIYDKNGTAKFTLPISDKCIYHKGIMEEEYVSLQFDYDNGNAFAKGDYIDTEFGRFEIVTLTPPADKTTSEGSYGYEQRFNPSWWRASLYKLFYSRQAGAEASWKMTHYPNYFMDIVVDNLKRIGLGDYSYEIDAELTEMKLVTFDGVDIISGLTLIAEAFETEWWITDNVIHLSRCEYGDAVPLSIGDEVNKIDREDSADTAYATRLYVFGSTRNLPQNYRRDESSDLVIEGVVERRLKLPTGIDHVDAWEDMAPEDVVEGIVVTDDIYPHRIGTISSIATKEYTETTENEDGTTTTKKWDAYRFTDTGITFSKEYVIDGEELRITFQSGALTGLDFAVTFNPDDVINEQDAKAQVWEIVRNEDYGVNLPTEGFAPAVGDTYILYGYDTSFVADTLVGSAEAELLEFAKKKVAETSAEKSNYNCDTNPVRCAGYTVNANGAMQYNESDVIDLDMGAKVKLNHPTYFGDTSREGRIRSFDKHLDNRYNCTYSIGEAAGYSRIGELTDNVNALTYQSKQYILSGGGTSVYLIKRQDSTPPSDHNAYSSLRSRAEFMLRNIAEYVRTRWTFAKGLVVGTFKQGESGAEIDEAGDAEVGGLLVRDALEVGGDATAKTVTATDNVVTPSLTTPNFRTGQLTGEGAGIYTNEGLTYGEFDYIVARRGMVLTELTIEEINSVGGGIIASKAHGVVDKVDNASTGAVTIWLKDNNQFVAGDFVRYAHYDYTNGKYRWAWVKVVSSSAEAKAIVLNSADFTSDMALPQVGDKLVQMGHATNAERQGFVYITTDGVQCYDGVNTTSLVGKCRGVFGDLSGITDNGTALSGYGVWTDRLYIGTGKTAGDTFTEITSKFEVVEGRLTSVQQSVTSLQTGGGRNLLLKTNQGVANWSATTNATYKPIITALDTDGVSGVLFDYPNGNISPTYESYDFALRKEVIKTGHTYTLSGALKASYADSSHQGQGLVLYLATKSGLSHLIGWGSITPRPVADERVSFTLTFTATATGATAEGDIYVRFAPQGADRGTLSSIAFRNLKLEEGDVATAWTAAPEDYVDGEIAEVQTSISEVEQTVDSISTRVEQVNTTLDGKINSNTTKISQNANAITSEVTERKSGDEALQSTIEQTASSISLRLSQMALSNVNCAYGTENAIKITSDFGNIENKTKKLYDVSGIAKGDIVTVSFLMRLKGITFGTNGVISVQFSAVYGYRGFPVKITQATLDALTPDANGYYTLRYQSTSTQITTDVDATVVGSFYMRLDYIDADATTDESVIEVSQLKIELGDTATAWTARTGDMDEALADTGIDISQKQIKATADNFKILNNLGAVTMEVDADGNLTSNAVLVRNTDPTTAEATPYLTTINLATGYLNTYYPLASNNGNNNLALQIGWDEGTESVFRFYSKEGVMAWKAGSQASLIDTTQSSQVVISPIDMYKCASTTQESAAAEIKTTKSLTATRLYQKTEQSGGTTTTTYYTDVNCTNAVTGYLTDAGLPAIFATNQITGTTYTRQLLAVTNGVASMPLIVKWTSNDATIN